MLGAVRMLRGEKHDDRVPLTRNVTSQIDVHLGALDTGAAPPAGPPPVAPARMALVERSRLGGRWRAASSWSPSS